jgi:4'-phosphopantetheinyl transferase
MNAPTWAKHSLSPPPLDADSVHIWRWGGEDTPPSSVSFAPDELARAQRLKIPAARARWLHHRGWLRAILAGYLEVMPSALHLNSLPSGKPILAAEYPPLHFNLAHTGDDGLLAISRARAVGIDLEVLRLLPQADYIANTAFTAQERAALAALPPDEFLAAFFRCWTRKEAVMKAHGEGFRLADQFSVSVDDPARVINAHPDVGTAWMLCDLPIEPPLIAALALAGDHPSPKLGLFNVA